MKGFIDRENTIFDVLEAVNDADLAYVVVGGYAVSAYDHRFSVDADLVIRDGDREAFATVLSEQGFSKAMETELDAYGGRFVAFEKGAELPVSIDLLVNGLTSRQTGASWSYDYIRENASNRTITGSERAVTAPVVDPAILIAVKLHSGRLTDVRDVVALAPEVEFVDVEDHLRRGDEQRLRAVLANALETLESDSFADSFKGVFVRQDKPTEAIARTREFLEEQIARLDR